MTTIHYEIDGLGLFKKKKNPLRKIAKASNRLIRNTVKAPAKLIGGGKKKKEASPQPQQDSPPTESTPLPEAINPENITAANAGFTDPRLTEAVLPSNPVSNNASNYIPIIIVGAIVTLGSLALLFFARQRSTKSASLTAPKPA